jgi:RNA polymerase sigma factor (TIGR02999 family)
MGDVTQILDAMGRGEQGAAGELLPAVYDDLRHLAATKLSYEPAGQTLQPTALVHEAWLRLVKDENRRWNDSHHFFCTAATAMRRILIENVRSKNRSKRGGDWKRIEFDECVSSAPMDDEMMLALDEALKRLIEESPEAVRLVELRYFAGFGHEEAAKLMGISRRAADGLWAYARGWLLEELTSE